MSAMLLNEVSAFINVYFEEQLDQLQNRLSHLNDQHEIEKKRLNRLILCIRQGKESQFLNNGEIFNEQQQATLNNSTDEVIYHLANLKYKGNLIKHVQSQGIEYLKMT